jgi:molecular chaperone GrpE
MAFESESRPEERPAEATEHPAEEPETAQPDAAEPAGEQDPGNEAEIEEATERSDGVEGSSRQSSVLSPQDDGAEDPIVALQRERDQYLELAKRAQADFENYRKRVAKEAAAAGDRAKGGLVRELLPVVDNLERALASAGEDEQHLAEGVRLVHQELVSVLQRNGVEAFDPAGEAFDPGVHEALSTRNEEGADPGVVLDVVEKGYRLNGTVLRPARVVVSG